MDHRLIYVNKIGYNHKGEATYEFIFCDVDEIDLDDVWGEGWLSMPAESNAQPPDDPCISKVGVIKLKDYELEVAHDSQYYTMSDAKSNVIALAYEYVDETFGGIRLVFHYGEKIDSIENKLKVRKLNLTYED